MISRNYLQLKIPLTRVLFASLLLLISPVFAGAQEGTEGSPRIEKRVRTIGVPFKSSSFGGPQSESVAVLSQTPSEPKAQFSEIPMDLPRCTQDRRRRLPIHAITWRTESEDFIVYSSLIPAELERGDQWPGRRLPYPPPKDRKFTPLQAAHYQFIDLYEVQCIPTRFHMTKVDGQAVMEYQEGQTAWENPPNPKRWKRELQEQRRRSEFDKRLEERRELLR